MDAKPKGYSQQFKDMVIRAYYERVGVLGIQRIFGVYPIALYRWLLEEEEKLPEIADTLSAKVNFGEEARSLDILEYDEM